MCTLFETIKSRRKSPPKNNTEIFCTKLYIEYTQTYRNVNISYMLRASMQTQPRLHAYIPGAGIQDPPSTTEHGHLV